MQPEPELQQKLQRRIDLYCFWNDYGWFPCLTLKHYTFEPGPDGPGWEALFRDTCKKTSRGTQIDLRAPVTDEHPAERELNRMIRNHCLVEIGEDSPSPSLG